MKVPLNPVSSLPHPKKYSFEADYQSDLALALSSQEPDVMAALEESSLASPIKKNR
jgi:hypothetical protein